jgi:hypothetical protein
LTELLALNIYATGVTGGGSLLESRRRCDWYWRRMQFCRRLAAVFLSIIMCIISGTRLLRRILLNAKQAKPIAKTEREMAR